MRREVTRAPRKGTAPNFIDPYRPIRGSASNLKSPKKYAMQCRRQFEATCATGIVDTSYRFERGVSKTKVSIKNHPMLRQDLP